jgi:hypothetical protein
MGKGELFRQPFKWLYILISVAMLLAPFYFLYNVIDMKVSGTFLAACLLIFVILLGLGWFSFQLWWNRKDQVVNLTSENDNFAAIPALAHLIQTTGEWFGCYLAILGFIASLLSIIFGVTTELSYYLNIGNVGARGLIYFPIAGFIIILIGRALAESIRALAEIANNTRK